MKPPRTDGLLARRSTPMACVFAVGLLLASPCRAQDADRAEDVADRGTSPGSIIQKVDFRQRLDESIPLKHGVIGQETQGPGGFFMALRSIHAIKGILADIERVAPRARLGCRSSTTARRACRPGTHRRSPAS